MVVSVPAVSGTTCQEGLLPYNRREASFLLSGGPRVPSTSLGASYSVVYSTFDGATFSYTFDAYPKFAGQLLWSNTSSSDGVFSHTVARARLFIAYPTTTAFPTPTGLTWLPVIPTRSERVINADTGKPMDYLGEYTCNPPWLCRG